MNVLNRSIEKLSGFYLWKYKDTEIDRRDFLASAIKWTIAAPLNFAIKQLTRKWQKGFDMAGERDGGKSEMAHIMLDIHGNFIDENSSSDSIYSVSSGSINTEAKFGKGMSKTTYPIEISEFGRIEAYGMVETVKKTILSHHIIIKKLYYPSLKSSIEISNLPIDNMGNIQVMTFNNQNILLLKIL